MFVEAKVLGRRGSGIEPREIAYAPSAPVSVRELIDHVVRDEVAAFADRERQRRFIHVLTASQIDAGVSAGKVDPGGRSAEAPVAPGRAVATALQAFEDGLFYVFVDGKQREELDDLVEVSSQTMLRFVRLAPLAGG